MLGLRTQENDKFLRFWTIVQDKAQSMGKCFFLDCGEGHDFEDEYIECEDLTGWLIDDSDKDEFNDIFLSNDRIGTEWANRIVGVEWKLTSEGIEVEFV